MSIYLLLLKENHEENIETIYTMESFVKVINICIIFNSLTLKLYKTVKRFFLNEDKKMLNLLN